MAGGRTDVDVDMESLHEYVFDPSAGPSGLCQTTKSLHEYEFDPSAGPSGLCQNTESLHEYEFDPSAGPSGLCQNTESLHEYEFESTGPAGECPTTESSHEFEFEPPGPAGVCPTTESFDEYVFDPSACPSVVCPTTEILFAKLMFCIEKYEMLDFDQECITAICEGLQECIKTVVRIMSSEQRLLAYGKNLIIERDGTFKTADTSKHRPMEKEKFSLKQFHELMKMHGEAIGNPTIYYRFLERILYKINDRSFLKIR